MRLSVIVPIYKVETYLRKCIDSILNQDLPSEDYEIILVDDGSPDGCGAIADEYASQYANVKVIHQENGGLSVARNTGIDAAQGKYIQFVDSDDFLEPNVLKTLVEKIENDDLDILRFDYQNVNEKYEVYHPYKDIKPFVDLRDEICGGMTFLNERLGYACYAVQFMIRKNLLIDKKIYFKPGIYFEDTEWTPRLLLASSRVTSIPLVAYNYLLRSGSITQSESIAKKRMILQDKLKLIESIQSSKDSATDNRWFDGMISSTVLSSLCLISTDFYQERRKYVNILQDLEVFPLSTYNSTARSRRKILIANFCPSLFCYIFHIKNK